MSGPAASTTTVFAWQQSPLPVRGQAWQLVPRTALLASPGTGPIRQARGGSLPLGGSIVRNKANSPALAGTGTSQQVRQSRRTKRAKQSQFPAAGGAGQRPAGFRGWSLLSLISRNKANPGKERALASALEKKDYDTQDTQEALEKQSQFRLVGFSRTWACGPAQPSGALPPNPRGLPLFANSMTCGQEEVATAAALPLRPGCLVLLSCSWLSLILRNKANLSAAPPAAQAHKIRSRQTERAKQSQFPADRHDGATCHKIAKCRRHKGERAKQSQFGAESRQWQVLWRRRLMTNTTQERPWQNKANLPAPPPTGTGRQDTRPPDRACKTKPIYPYRPPQRVGGTRLRKTKPISDSRPTISLPSFRGFWLEGREMGEYIAAIER